MLLRQLFGTPCYTHFLKVTSQPHKLTFRGFAISNDVVTSIPHDDEDDFFGITNDDLCNKSKTIPSNSPSNEDNSSKEAIFAKHLPKDVQDNNMEKYVNTKFGKIRFDWQNTIPSKVREISSLKMKESPRSNHDMDYFSEMYFGHSLGETQENTATVTNNPNPVENKDINPKFNSEDNLDFINSQYFGDHGENVSSNYTQSPKSVVLEETETFPHDPLQLFDFKKISSNTENFTSDDNFIESQYFSNTKNNTLQAESDSNASINNYEANFSHAAKNDFKESFPTKSFENDNIHFPNLQSSQSTEQKECISKKILKPQNAFEASQKIRSEFKKKDGGNLFFILQKTFF